MPFSIQSYAIWALATLLGAACVLLLFRRGLAGRLPAFTAYLLVLMVYDASAWWIYHTLPLTDPKVFTWHWTGQAVLVSLRAVVIAEICRRVLMRYRGVWGLARLLLVGLAAVLVGTAVVAAWGQAHWMPTFILTAQRGLELAAVSVLVLLAVICRVYAVPIARLEGMLALGLGTFSAIQVINNAVARQWVHEFFPWWDFLHAASFTFALALWAWALAAEPAAARAAEPAAAPEPAGEYAELAPVVSRRLRELNARLEEMLRQ